MWFARLQRIGVKGWPILFPTGVNFLSAKPWEEGLCGVHYDPSSQDPWRTFFVWGLAGLIS